MVDRMIPDPDPMLHASVALAALDPAQDSAAIAERFGVTTEEVELWRDRLIARAPDLFAPRKTAPPDPEAASLTREIRLLQRREQRRFHEIATLTRMAQGRGWLQSLRAAPGSIAATLPRRAQLRAAILAQLSPQAKRRIKRLLGRVS